MNVILLFVDGLGLGPKDPDKNPFYRIRPPLLPCWEDGLVARPADRDGVLIPTEATLNVPGLPQSATGQTALFTGVNAAELLGRHLPGFPNEILRQQLREHSILRRVREMGLRGTFLNAYRPLFFRLKERTKWRLSTTTVAALAAGQEFFRIEDVRHRRSLYHDFTNEDLVRRQFEVDAFSSEEAGGVLARVSEDYDFILYEYFLTDRAGHTQEMPRAVGEVKKLQDFLQGLLDTVDLQQSLVLLTSDHGNIEDLSIRTHTRNRVPTLIWGRGVHALSERIRTILDITPLILEILSKESTEKVHDD